MTLITQVDLFLYIPRHREYRLCTKYNFTINFEKKRQFSQLPAVCTSSQACAHFYFTINECTSTKRHLNLPSRNKSAYMVVI